MTATAPLRWLGASLLAFASEAGALALLAGRCLRSIVSRSMEWRETLRQGREFGIGSLVVLVSTAALVGSILVVQAGLYVKKFGVQELVGWLVGFGVLREIGPLVAGLCFSGRVGSRNAAEIAAMSTRDQLEGLRAIGVDAIPAVVAPRAVAMVGSLVGLYFVCSAVAIATAALAAWGLLDVDFHQFTRSFRDRTQLADLVAGVSKCGASAVAIALISCRAGLTAKGGASAVGAAAKAAVVRAAFAIVALDLLVAQFV